MWSTVLQVPKVIWNLIWLHPKESASPYWAWCYSDMKDISYPWTEIVAVVDVPPTCSISKALFSIVHLRQEMQSMYCLSPLFFQDNLDVQLQPSIPASFLYDHGICTDDGKYHFVFSSTLARSLQNEWLYKTTLTYAFCFECAVWCLLMGIVLKERE